MRRAEEQEGARCEARAHMLGSHALFCMAHSPSHSPPHLLLLLSLCLHLLEGVCGGGGGGHGSGSMRHAHALRRGAARRRGGWGICNTARRNAESPLTVDESAGGLIHVIVALRQHCRGRRGRGQGRMRRGNGRSNRAAAAGAAAAGRGQARCPGARRRQSGFLGGPEPPTRGRRGGRAGISSSARSLAEMSSSLAPVASLMLRMICRVRGERARGWEGGMCVRQGHRPARRPPDAPSCQSGFAPFGAPRGGRCARLPPSSRSPWLCVRGECWRLRLELVLVI